MTQKYKLEELLTCIVARELKANEIGFIGIGTGGQAFILAVGIPAVASRLAQLTHAPGFIPIFGPLIGPDYDRVPTSQYEYDLINWESISQIPVQDSWDIFKSGRMDVGFISGAQVDMYGNTNIVCIGDHKKPKVRLVGPLAQPDHATGAKRTIIIMKHERRNFVKKVDFITGVGHLDGGTSRNDLNLRGGGPSKVITNLAVMDFEENSKRMRLVSLHPGVDIKEVVDNTGFELIIPDSVPETVPPTEDELTLIRKVIDPKGLWLEAKISGQAAHL